MMMSGLDKEAIEQEVAVNKQLKNKTANAETAAKRAETAAKREERLAAKNAPVPVAAAPPAPEVDKSALLDKIFLFRERFPHLKARNKVSAKSSAEELEDELHYIEQQLGQKDGHMGGHLLVLAMSGIEESTKYYNPMRLNLTGLATVTRSNLDQFGPILDELFIKYGATMYVGPELRLVMAVGTLVYTVHSANSGNPIVAEALSKMNKEFTPPKTDL